MIDVHGLLAKGSSSSSRVGIALPSRGYSALRKQFKQAGSEVEIIRYSDASALLAALSDAEIDAAVRGVLDSSEVLAEIKRSFSMKSVMRCAVMEDSRGREFLLAPVGIDEGTSARSRVEIAEAAAKYFSRCGWNVSCGILSRGRAGDASRGENIRSSLGDGEKIARELRSAGLEATHFEIMIEDAIGKSDLVLAPDGVAGNLIFRTLYFLGAGRAYGAPVVNLESVFVDTSRAKSEFSDSVLLAAGLAETRTAVRRA